MRRLPPPRTAAQALVAARCLYPRSPGFQTAYRRGWRAGRAGLTLRSCPYHAAGWKVWQTTWRQGWLAGARARAG